MTYNYPEIKRFKGLYLQANSFDLPDGALEECNNAIISKDGIISKIRGSYNYYQGSTDTLKSTFLYKGKLFGICSDKIYSFTDSGGLPNLTGVPTQLTGSSISVTGTRQSRILQQNNNAYMTTDNGVMKIESITDKIRLAGTPPALDLTGDFLPENGNLPGNNQYGWRVLFGRRDANNNLLLGAPSDFLFMNNQQYTASWVRTSASLVTVTMGAGVVHNLNTSTPMTITVTNASVTALNGTRTATVTANNTFTFVPAADPVSASGTLEFYSTRNARINFSIPSEISDITDGYFYQIYRTSGSGSTSASPFLDFALIDEIPLTAADLAARVVIYDDKVNPLFRGAELYTNPGSREGEAQQNTQPPLCEDMCIFKNHIFYGAATTRGSVDINLVKDNLTSTYIANGDYVEFKRGSSLYRYIARSGIGNKITKSYSVSAAGGFPTNVTITLYAHGVLATDTIRITSVVGTLPSGDYVPASVTTDTITIAVAGAVTCTSCNVMIVKNQANQPVFKLSTDSSNAVQIRETALGIVRAVNYDTTIPIYAFYSSTNVGMPGMMKFSAVNFGDSFSVRASSGTVGSAFSPTLPDSFSTGTQVSSVSELKDAGFYSSKIGEGEAVPLANFFPVGSQNKKLLRLIALRDSVLAIKEDGIWRIDGDSVFNFAVTSLDSTTICLAPNSVDSINNQVIFLSNQGVCLATSNAVRIVSRDIETPIKAVLGSSVLSAQTTGVAYESERLYFLTTIKPGSTVADVTWVYNTLSDAWSSCDYRFLTGAVGPNDTLYWVDRSNNIKKERKSFDRTDFCGEYQVVSVSAISADLKTLTMTATNIPAVGDVIIELGIVNRIKSVTNISTNLWSIGLLAQTSIVAPASPIMYAAYDTTIKLSPFHAGAIGRMKQFAQMQLHLRDNSVRNVDITFAGQNYGSSPTVNWTSEPISSSLGWGLEPWGMFGWGQSDSTAITYKTEQAPVVRVYIPLVSQRSTYIQPIIVHPNAAEEINLQAVTFAVRGYNERVTK